MKKVKWPEDWILDGLNLPHFKHRKHVIAAFDLLHHGPEERRFGITIYPEMNKSTALAFLAEYGKRSDAHKSETRARLFKDAETDPRKSPQVDRDAA